MTHPAPPPHHLVNRLASHLANRLGGVLAAAIWLVAAAWALVLGGALAVALWASSPVSLPQALRWTQAWLGDGPNGTSPLQVEGASGSLLRGGRIERLGWADADWALEAREVQISWSAGLWLALWRDRALRLESLEIGALQIQDLKARPEPTPPPTPPASLTLPWLQTAVLPLRLQTLTWVQATPVVAGPVHGHYRYDTEGHALRLEQLGWQEGRYRLEATLRHTAPLTLQARLSGQVTPPALADWPSQTLEVEASLSGAWADPDARLPLSVRMAAPTARQAGDDTPLLHLDTELRPWAAWPLGQTHLRFRHLNVAAFWPGGPSTQLQGHWTAHRTPDPATGDHWHLQGELHNLRPLPLDQQGWPIDRLQAEALLSGTRWELRRLQARLGGGELLAQGRRDASAPSPSVLAGTEVDLRLQRVQLSALWSSAPQSRLNAQGQLQATADGLRWQLALQPEAPVLPHWRGQGLWKGQTVTLQTWSADWMGSRLEGLGQLQTTGSGQGQLVWQAPGLRLRLDGHWPMRDATSEVQATLDDLQAFQRWSHTAAQTLGQAWPTLDLRRSAPFWWETPLQGKMTLQAQAQGPLDALHWSGQWAGQIEAQTPALHAALAGLVRLSGTASAGPQGWQHRIQWAQTWLVGGPKGATPQWRGELVEPTEWQIDPDGTLTLQPGQWRLRPVQAPTAGAADSPPPEAHIRWGLTRLQADEMQSQLQVEGVPLGWLAPWVTPGWRLTGEVSGAVQLSGSRAQPDWQGQLALRELGVRSPLDGLDFSDGQALARFSGERLVIEQLRVRGAGGAEGGWLSGHGEVQWPRDPAGQRQPTMALQLQARSLRLLARADRRLVVSGELQAQLQGQALTIGGQLRADQALLWLPEESTPTLGRDVVVRGGAQPPALSDRLPLQTRLDVGIDLGPRFEVRGLGVQTLLAGQLRVHASAGQATPSVTGDVQAERGSYRAYGQRLDIRRGRVRFNGPYDNPSLEILAIRPHPTQQVGVEITGSAQNPRVRLYADPDLPDSEKLAWLVLGRPASGAGAEAAMLQQAALALLSGQGNDGSLVQRLGLDELSFQGQALNPDGTTTAAAVTLGKRLSERLYVSYTRSVTGAVGTVAVLLDVSRWVTLRAQAGDDNALDVIFSRAFDHWRNPRTIPPISP
jgi:hypothetical protein